MTEQEMRAQALEMAMRFNINGHVGVILAAKDFLSFIEKGEMPLQGPAYSQPQVKAVMLKDGKPVEWTAVS